MWVEVEVPIMTLFVVTTAGTGLCTSPVNSLVWHNRLMVRSLPGIEHHWDSAAVARELHVHPLTSRPFVNTAITVSSLRLISPSACFDTLSCLEIESKQFEQVNIFSRLVMRIVRGQNPQMLRGLQQSPPATVTTLTERRRGNGVRPSSWQWRSI